MTSPPRWKALDEEEEAFEDIKRFDEFVDTWAMRQTYQKDYVTRCLERAARRRRRCRRSRCRCCEL